MSSFSRVKGLASASISWLRSSVLLGILVISSGASADDALCDASQASINQLPVLAENCPIGNGVWGSKVPVSEGAVYWIQCGILEAPMPLEQAMPLYSEISSDVWMLPQKSSYRCLIGPYTNVNKAKQDLNEVKGIRGYRDAFIRVVERGEKTAKASSSSQSNPTGVKAAFAKPQVSEQKLAKQAIPKPAASQSSSPATSKSVKKAATIPELPTTKSSPLSVRLSAELDGKRYAVPYLSGGDHQFYMEHDKAWNRLSYNSAIKVCSDLDMHLVSNTEWQALVDSKVMVNNQWPLQMPYWGDGQKGLFTNGKVSPLKGNTLLNVVCVGK
ncbi:SPOR domain-containing protein [Vibrio sp. SCSIO 43140]|uniref:SPOR domain-containing protein n=1 Tax=Vibrio sp. SCSIO 43140 TaxID=2819100 RepID=UPI00207549D5|nr:SPOR domain-containing protein [Vibrio sp. SCSIO 43140]USD60506.1 SPOR domain-containing protein [Vibrio sp. SCSIO 43140]